MTHKPVSGSFDHLRPTADRRNILSVRFSDVEIEILNAVAQKRKMSVSDLVRRQCFGNLMGDDS